MHSNMTVRTTNSGDEITGVILIHSKGDKQKHSKDHSKDI